MRIFRGRSIVTLAASLILSAAISSASPADAAVRVGLLACNVDENQGSVIAVSKAVQCDYWPVYGIAEHYTGTISNLSAGLGNAGDEIMAWDVIAPAAGPNPFPLAGAYGRASFATPQSAAGTLIGDAGQSIELRPVSRTSDASFANFAAGVGGLILRPHSRWRLP